MKMSIVDNLHILVLTEKYTLRQTMYGRKTELAIVMTMYNEDEKLFDNTMTAVTKVSPFQTVAACGRLR